MRKLRHRHLGMHLDAPYVRASEGLSQDLSTGMRQDLKSCLKHCSLWGHPSWPAPTLQGEGVPHSISWAPPEHRGCVSVTGLPH